MKARPKVIRLVLGTALGELEVDVAASEAAVDLGVSVQAVVDATTLLLVKDDLEELAAVLLGAETLADNLNGVGEVGQDGVVDSGESAGAGTLLLLGVARAGRALGAGQDAARGEDQDVAVGELLLELTGEALLDAVEALQGRDGDKDDNSLLAVANLDLTGRDELQRAQGDLEIGSVGLEVVQSLSNVLLKLRGVLPRRAVGGDLVEDLGGHLDVVALRLVVRS
jgi:hypothetical protein